MPSERRPGGAARRVYHALLRLYPRSFRARHGDEMARLFAEKHADAARRGRGAVGALWLRTLWDAVHNGIAERLDRVSKRDGIGDGIDGKGGGGGMDGFTKDLRYAVRALLRSPGFTVVAVGTIALGIGANTAIFSVVRAVLLQPLPYDDPSELVVLWGEMRARDVEHFPFSPPDFRDYREGSELLEDLGGIFTFPVSITGDGDPVQVTAAGVTPTFLGLLGVEPALGRGFVEADGTPDPSGAQPGTPGSLPTVALLSNALWQQRYGGDPGAVGRTIDVGGGPTEIVGVMPPGFELLVPPEAALHSDVGIWLASRLDYDNAPRNNVFIRPIGRLRDGATPEQLQAEVDRISSELSAHDQVKATAGYAVRVAELHEEITAGVRPVILALFGAVFFVLLIACANVSNLLLVRASGRDRELAVRSALGGSRRRLIRQMLLESGVLAAAGAGVGIALAFGGIDLLLALQPDNLPRIDNVRIDAAVLGFTVLAAAGAALIFGVLPAVQGSRVELVEALKERGQVASSKARKAVRNGVVVTEVALSVVLLIGAGLMVRSFAELADVEPGFDSEAVLTFTTTVPFARYPQAAQRADFVTRLQARMEAIPGVRTASLGQIPLSGTLLNGRYGTEEALTDPEAFRQAAYRGVLPGYFEAMGTRLLEGRTLTHADQADSAAVVVVDEVLAAALWPDESAVGKRVLVRVTTPEPVWVEVVGVVEHQRSEDLSRVGMETIYFTDRYFGSFGGNWVLKAGVEPLALMPAVREAVDAVDPDIPIADVRLMESYVDEAMGPTRFALTSIGVFGLIALLLASVGLYGVLSYTVHQRTAEIGVRMAFGAERGAILRLVVGQGLGLAGTGIVLGVLIALPVTGVMESLLVGVEPTDPATFGGISLVFAAVASLACYLPARRATRVDPVTALRED